jgi:hypothetical protein
VTSRQLIAWSRRYDRAARGGWWSSPIALALIAGGVLAAFVEWRRDVAGDVAASHAWLAATTFAFALAFMRVPFHIYWRRDAAILAQLPIGGAALLDAALLRCFRAAATTTLAMIVGVAPIAFASAFAWRPVAAHVTYACVLGLTAGALLPATAMWAAWLVATSHGARGIEVAIAIAGGSPARAMQAATRRPDEAPTPLLGALPGFVSSAVIVTALLASPMLLGNKTFGQVAPELVALVGVSLAAIVATRVLAPASMPMILRDVSALDRQRLAPLEIRELTAIERAIAGTIGDAALLYRKDAQLMRRRYPMAFALGALCFIVLAIIGAARPADPIPWLVVTLASISAYGIALGRRLDRPPIELVRVSDTLPISASARGRAKRAWLAGWWTTFVVVPGLFALARLDDRAAVGTLLGGATAVVVAASITELR